MADTLSAAQSSLTAPPSRHKRRGRPPADETEFLETIRAVIAGLPSYGYRRVWAVLKREPEESGQAPFDHKRIYRVMQAHGLLLQRHSGLGPERRL